MEKTIGIPNGVDATVEGRTVTVKGPKGSSSRSFDNPRFNSLVAIEKKDSSIVVSSAEDTRKQKAICGTFAAHINNMMRGVTHGFRYEMKIIYTHFPMTVGVNKGVVEIKNFLGEKGARIARIAGNADVKADKESVVITGPDKEEVGRTASNIESACKLTKRDRRVFQDGIYITKRGVDE